MRSASPLAARLAAAALLGLALWSSLHYALWSWTADGDIAGPWLVWVQLHSSGLSALTQWRYAIDNWLFSLILPAFVAFAAGLDTPRALIVGGWVILLASSALVFLLLRRAGCGRLSLPAALVPLLGGQAPIGGVGYLSYPVSHCVSVFWMLLALLAITRRGAAALALATLALFVGSASDPWLVATGTLPLLLALLAVAALRRPVAAAALRRAGLVALVMVLVQTRLLGLLWFLPRSPYVLGSLAKILRHLPWDATYVSLLLNAVPLRQTTSDWTPPGWAVAIDVLLVALLVLPAAWRLWRRRDALPPTALLLAAYAALAGAAILAAFTLSNVVPILVEGRYLSILVFVLPMLVALALAHGPGRVGEGRIAAGFAAAWFALFVASGVAAAPGQLARLPDSLVRPSTRDLVRFLEAHGLDYGYGTFWGTLAPAVQWVSHGRVVIRPLASYWPLLRVEPRFAQSFPAWYRPSDPPPSQKTFFFVAAPDGETCPDVAACVALAEHTFGAPARTLTDGDIPVLVWDHPLLGAPPPSAIAAAPVLVPGVPLLAEAGGGAVGLQWMGWGRPEAFATWTEAHRAVLLVHLPAGWSGPARIVLTGGAYTRRSGATQAFFVTLDGRVVGRGRLGEARGTIEAAIPAEAVGDGRLALVIHSPDAVSPSTLGRQFDPRVLGLYLRSVELLPP